MPGITVETASFDRQKRRASSGRRARLRTQEPPQGFRPLEDLAPAVALEVVVAEVALGERGVGPDLAREPAFVEGHPGEHAQAVGGAGGKQGLGRALIVDVVEDLQGVEEARGRRAEGRVGVVLGHGDARRSAPCPRASGPGARPSSRPRPGTGRARRGAAAAPRGRGRGGAGSPRRRRVTCSAG